MPSASDHPSALVADQPASLVERDPGDRLPGVADRAEHELRRDLLERPGAARGQRTVVARDDLVVLDLHGADVAVGVAEQLDRGGEEAEADGDRLAGLRPRGVVLDDLDVAPAGLVGLLSATADSSSSSAADDLDVAALELAHLEQLGVRERGLERAAASEDRDLLDPARAQHLDRVVGGIGDLELGRRQREHPRDVDRDVARADDHHLLGLEVDLEARVVGMAVVPGDELGRGVRAAEVLAGDPQPLIDRGPDRVQTTW